MIKCCNGFVSLGHWCPDCGKSYHQLEIERDLADRVTELEKQVNRVPGSVPGDYTWDELVGNDDRRT